MTRTNMLLVFFLVILFTAGFLTALFYETSSVMESKMASAFLIIQNELDEHDTYSEKVFDELKPKNGVNFALYTKDLVCIYSTVDGFPTPPLDTVTTNIRYIGEDPIDGKEEFEFVIESGKWIKDDTLYLYLFSDVTEDMEVVEHMPYLIAAMLVAGLIVSFFVGRIMSAMMLRPVKEISSQMRAITANNLNERLPENASKDELQELAHSFNLMIERLEKAFSKQNQFVSDASHELRTPLAVMQGHTSMLRRWGKEDKTTLENSLETLHTEIRGMTELIDKLLILAKNENTSQLMKKETIELAPLLTEIIDEMKLIDPDANFTIDCATETIYADNAALKQVLRILLNNSMKFCPPPGKITLSAVRNNNGTQITVADEGIGIEYEKLPFVFDRFYCVDSSRTKKKGGTGLGLAIAKTIIDSHHGTIRIESQPGKGTQVIIWLENDAI